MPSVDFSILLGGSYCSYTTTDQVNTFVSRKGIIVKERKGQLPPPIQWRRKDEQRGGERNLNGDRGSRQLWLTQLKPINNRRISPVGKSWPSIMVRCSSLEGTKS